MPAPDYAAEIAQLRAALASGVLAIESNGRRKTYRSAADLRGAIEDFERLAGTRRRRRTRFMAASFRSDQ